MHTEFVFSVLCCLGYGRMHSIHSNQGGRCRPWLCPTEPLMPLAPQVSARIAAFLFRVCNNRFLGVLPPTHCPVARCWGVVVARRRHRRRHCKQLPVRSTRTPRQTTLRSSKRPFSNTKRTTRGRFSDTGQAYFSCAYKRDKRSFARQRHDYCTLDDNWVRRSASGG
jgi:hypothetical protein